MSNLRVLLVNDTTFYDTSDIMDLKKFCCQFLLWTCTYIVSCEEREPPIVWVQRVGSTSIEIRWKTLHNSVNNVKTYIAQYCPIKSPLNTDCKSKINQRIFDAVVTDSGNLTNLTPYTTYRVDIFQNRAGDQEIGVLYNTTLEAAPTPVRNLRIADVTNSSIFVKWDAPVSMNGMLKFYQVQYGHGNDYHRVKTNLQNYKLVNLEHLKRYNVTVAACTVMCSPSQTLSVLTELNT